jgi:hypothetical protein
MTTCADTTVHVHRILILVFDVIIAQLHALSALPPGKEFPKLVIANHRTPMVQYVTTCNFFITNLMHKILVYSHIIHLLKSSTCFEHYSAHLQEVYVVIVYMQPLVSSLSAGDCPVHRLRKFFLNRRTRQSPVDSDDTRGCIYTITT